MTQPRISNVDEPTSGPRAATPCGLMPRWAGEFHSFDDWVNFATKRLSGARGSLRQEVAAICVDAKGRRCSIGGEFMRARDEGAFPVRYFWECQPAPSPEGKVLIWSNEHYAYWRPNSSGYTTDGLAAGIYDRAAAESIVAGVGPEKKLELRPIDMNWPILAAFAIAEASPGR
jgi:hypothetical protein